MCSAYRRSSTNRPLGFSTSPKSTYRELRIGWLNPSALHASNPLNDPLAKDTETAFWQVPGEDCSVRVKRFEKCCL